MDHLARQLKKDAANIEVEISPELEQRLRAAVSAVSPQRSPAARIRGPAFWWASSLSGVAAALLIVTFVNFSATEERPDAPGASVSPVTDSPTMPVLDWKTESAMLIGPLQQELDALQSDIKKAQERVKGEIGL